MYVSVCVGFSFVNVISGTGGLTKIGTETQTLSGINTFTGPTTIDAGTLALTGGAALDDASAVSLLNVLNAQLVLNTGETIGSLAGGGGTGGNVNLNANTLTVGSDNTSTSYSGNVFGTGGLTKVGTGTLTLNGVNTFTGPTTIDAGTLALTGGAALDDASAVSLLDVLNAQLVLNTSETIGSLAGGGATGGNVNFNANTLTVGSDNTSTSYSGVISGAPGVLSKTGDGTLTLNGANVIGTTNVTQGMLNISGSVTGTVNVFTAGTLMGTGTVTGTLNNLNGGTVAPGNSIGTLNVDGSYVQNSGSTLDVEAQKTGGGVITNDVINVTGAPGTATLVAGSTIRVIDLAAGGTFGNLDAMTIITTVGGVFLVPPNTNPTIDQTASGLDPLVHTITQAVSGNDYVLTVLLNPISPRAAGSNNLVIAGVLDADAGLAPAGSDFELLYIGLLSGTDAELNAGLQQLSPTPHNAVSEATLRSAQHHAGELVNHLHHRRAGMPELAMLPGGGRSAVPVRFASTVLDPYLLAAALGERQRNSPAMMTNYQAAWAAGADSPWKVFAKMIGQLSDQDSDTDRIGFSADSVGVQIGADKEFHDVFGNSAAEAIVGFAFGYIHTDLDLDGGRGDGTIDSIRIGPFASYYVGRWFVDGSLTYGLNLNNLDRNVIFDAISRTANGDYAAHEISVFLGGGYDIPVGGFTITPDGSIQYTGYFSESFTETGAGAANLHVDSRDIQSLRSMLGVRVSPNPLETKGSKVMPVAFIGWAHEFRLDDNDEIDAVFTSGATSFTIDPTSASEDSIYYGVGVTAQINEAVSARFGYVGETSPDGQFHGLSGSVIIGF
ncbi:MAG: autotransporter domain-containing protein [Phycisphaeraceae bacterium]